MTHTRRLMRSLLFACLATFPMVAHAAVTELRVLFDTDNNPATGCTVNGMTGVEQVLVTQISDDGTTANVTQTHRLICAGGVLGGPVDVNTNGAAVGFQSSSGSMLLEAAIPFGAFGSGMPPSMRIGFAGTRGGASFSVITQSNGDPLMFPRGPAGRRHAVAHPGPERVIVVDGQDPDWNGISPLAPGSAGGGASDIKLVQAFAFANSNDNTLYFKFNVNTKGSGIQAVNDTYVRTQGDAALTEPAPGVLGNDISNGVPLTAVPVGGPDHGQLTLGSDGGFTYEPNDPDSLETDTFFYKATHDSDESNVASVQILVEQNSVAPAFTSANGVQLQVGQTANFTVTTSGVPPPAITRSGALPPGVTFTDNGDGTATIGGIPTTGGSYPLVFTAINVAGNATQNFTIIVCGNIVVTNPANTNGTAGAPFSETFTQTGAVGSATFSLFSGTLPAGLTLATNGTLSGTPTVTGSFQIRVRVTDSNGCTGTGAIYTLAIGCQTITVTNPATNTGTAGAAFSQTFTQSGAIGAATFSLNSGVLPAGLTLAANGTLSGTPTQTGSFPITVRATDSNGCFGVGATYTLTVGCQTITVTNPATNTGTAGVAFSQTFTQTGAIGGATFTTGSTLPAGLTLATNGTLSGTPTQTGSFPIVVTVTDGNGCTGTGATYNLVINCPTITVTNPATTTGTVNAGFSQTFTQTGAVGGATFTLNSGVLPAGLTLSTGGLLAGIPTQSGSFPITVLVTDGNGCTGVGATYNLVINCQTITVTNPANTTGPAGTPFSATFTQTGGILPVTFTTSSTLPTGLSLSAAGVLSGTPSQGGTFPITVLVTDANGCTGTSAVYNLIITCPTITVINPVNSNGTANAAFSETFTQTGAVGSATFTINTGTLPAGLALSTAGVLSGIPTQTGSFPITVKVTDSNGCTGIGATYTIVIACQTITVSNPGVNTGTVNIAFSQTFTQVGAIGTATFTTASTLPTGLSLATNGTLSGTPTQNGSFPILVTVTDSNGCTGTGATYTLTIGCQVITVNNPGVNTGTVNAPFSQIFTASNTIGAVTFSTASTLPAGITLAANGTLAGTPTQTGSFPIVVTATDANGCTGTGATYTLTIGCQTITVTNPANTSGTVNAAFSETFTQTGAVGGATFTLNSGVLPAGLTLSTGGVLAGVPTEDGSFPITVLVTDGNGCTGVSATYTLVISCQTITVTNPSNATGAAGSPFSETFTQTGGILPVTFTINTGTLPTGLTLSTAGVLSGTPTQGGPFPITVLVTDANGCTGVSATYPLNITCPTITVTNPANTNGTANAAFSETFTQTGAVGGATFTTASTLPTGLSLSAAGVLTGIPTQTGSFLITVLVTDGNGCTGTSAVYPLTIGCQTITVTNPANAAGVANAAFSETFTQTGAILPVTFTINTGTLPTGLSLSTAGVLSGTPTQTGSFPITVKVTDSNGCTGIGAPYPIVITCQTITVTNPANATGTILVGFSETFTQTGAIGTATFTVNTGTLPNGLTLSAAGVLSGTPTQTGSFPITVKVTDSNGCTGIGATYTIIINCQTITVTNPGVTAGTVNAAFSQTFTQTGANGGATFTLNSGVLPNGLTLATNGTLSGIPTQTGSFPITVLVTDGNGCTGTSAVYPLTIGCQTITVTNPANANGVAGSSFSETFTQVGGFGATTFTLNSGTLPTGLSLSGAGVLSGIPTQTGSFPITVKATDANGCTGIGATYTIVISCQTITVTNPGVTTGTVNAPFSQTFTQTGAIGTATFTTASALPAGLVLATNGTLSGMPTQNGSFPIVVTVTDSNGCTGTGATYTLVIACQVITVTNPANANGTAGVAFSETFTQTGAVGTATFTLNSGTLPNGLTLATNGTLSGTPTQNGSFPITVLVTDSNGCTGVSATYNLFIACPTFTFVPTNTMPAATYQTAYSQNITVSGGAGPYVLTLANATNVPTSFTFTDNGNGTATVASANVTVTGNFTFDVKVVDSSSNCTQTQTFSLAAIPKVTNDIYAASGGNAGTTDSVGNTESVAAGFSSPTTPFVSYTNGVLANDAAPPATLTVVTASVTNAAGTITFNPAGGWSYVPAVNFIGTATFNFVVASNGAQANASINIAVSNKVWYVRNNGAAGNGVSSTPFNTLAAAQTASAIGETIYVMTGDGTTTGQNAGITLKNNQQLLGAGVALVVNGNTLAAAGTKPQITNSAVTSDAITLADGNTVKGLTVTAATRDGIAGSAKAGFTGDTLTIQNNVSSGLHLTNVTGTVTLTNTTFSGNGIGLDVDNGTATINVDNTNTIGSSAGQRTVRIQNRGAGANTITLGAAINDNGTGISLTSNTVGTISFTGTQTLATTTNAAVTMTSNTGSTTSFSGTLAITTTTGSAINATGGGTLNVTGTANVTTGAAATGVNINGMTTAGITFTSVNTTGATTGVALTNITGTITISGGTISGGTTGINGSSFSTLNLNSTTITGTTGTGVTLTTGTLGGTGSSINSNNQGLVLNTVTIASGTTFTSVSSAGGAQGISLTTVTGNTLTISGGTLAANTAAGFFASGGNASVTFGGSITSTGFLVDITGRTGGTVTFATGTLGGAGALAGTGIRIQNSTGTSTYTFSGTQTLGTSGGRMASTAVTLAGNNSTTTFNFSGTLSIFTNAVTAFSATGPTGGTINFSGTDSIDATAASALVLNGVNLGSGTLANVTSTGGTSGISLTTVTGGTLTISAGALSGATNATFLVSGGTVSVTDAGTIAQATAGQPVVSVTGHGTGTLTFNGAVTATNGTGLQFDNADGTYNFNSATNSLAGGDAGVDILNGSGGTFSFAAGMVITNPTGIAFNVSASTPASITYAGNITANNNRAVSISHAAAAGCSTQTYSGSITGSGASATGIIVNNCNAGTIGFTGSTLTLSTQANNALTFTGNSGATINLSGGNLSLTTVNGHGVTATGGGTVNITGNDNTITTTGTGTAFNWAMLTGLHSNGTLRFKSINKSGGGSKAIVVNYHNGSFAVTGDDDNNGVPDSVTAGGTITGAAASTRGAEIIDVDGAVTLAGMTFTNSVGTDGSTCGGSMGTTEDNLNCSAAIHLVDTSGGVTLRLISINGSSQAGINGNKVTNLAMTDITVQNAGDEIDEHGIAIKNLLGTGTATNLNLHDNESRQLYIVNANNNDLTSFSITNSTFANSPAPNGGQGILLESHNAGTSMNVSVDNGLFQNLFTNAYQVAANTSSTQTVSIINSTFTNVNSWMVIQASAGTINYSVQTNDGTTGVLSGSGAINIKTDNGGTASGDITSNLIGGGAVGSGAVCGGGCSGLFVNQRQGGSLTANIVGNTIRHVDSSGIFFSGGQDSGFGAGKMNVVLTGNLIQDPDGAAPAQAIAGQSGIISGDVNCLAATVGGLTVPGGYPSTAADAKNRIVGNWDPTPGSLGNEIFLFRNIATAFFRIPTLAGGATAWVTARNDITSADGTSVFTSNVTTGTCP